MKSLLSALVLFAASSGAYAVQETFLTAGSLDCSSVSFCYQNTTDGLFKMRFVPTYPTSSPSSLGMNVNEPSIEIYSNGPTGTLDLNIMQVSLIASNFYNGANFIGAVQIEALYPNGIWQYLSQWSSYIGSSKGIYVMFNGKNASSPLIKDVKGIRLTGINGTTGFRIGMMNLTAK